MLVRRTADYPDRERVYLHILNGSMDCIYEVSLRRPDTFDPGVPPGYRRYGLQGSCPVEADRSHPTWPFRILDTDDLPPDTYFG